MINSVCLPRLRCEGTRFVDESGRQVLLRGLNLGGDCKVPCPDGGTQHPTDFADAKTVSFIGRPFSLCQAREHFARIRDWGMNCLRLLTTWEAVEHGGPGQYDHAYIEYFAEISRLAGEHGLYVFVDFHQDVWSRASGGDGAPLWTFSAVGLDHTKFHSADAAIVMQQRFDYNDPRDRQPENYATMCWPQNYLYPANGIMWTLFFAGRDFAPGFEIDGRNVQDYLQDHYLGSVREIAKAVGDQSHVIGFDSLNEPSAGWIGRPFSERPLRDVPHDPARGPGHVARPGHALAPRDALAMAAGQSVNVEYLEISWLRGRLAPRRTDCLNPNSVSIWLSGYGSPFRVDGPDTAVTNDSETQPLDLPEDFFQSVRGRRVDFDRDYLFPFVSRVARTIRAERADWLIFAEKDAFDTMNHPDWPVAAGTHGSVIPAQTVNAAHWYDGLSLFLKRYLYPITFDVLGGRPVFGRRGIRAMYRRQMDRLRCASEAAEVPTLIGEFGIQFDFNQRRAYKRYERGRRDANIWKTHVLALDLMYGALDDLQLSATLWNYTASNQSNARAGDGWNQEDLSVYCAEHGGGRAEAGFVRPYPRFIAGRLLRTDFDLRRGIYELEYLVDSRASSTDPLESTTEVFVPRLQFPDGFRTEVLSENARCEFYADRQLLVIHPGTADPTRASSVNPIRVRLSRR